MKREGSGISALVIVVMLIRYALGLEVEVALGENSLGQRNVIPVQALVQQLSYGKS